MKIGIIIGHNEKENEQGAVNYLGETEFFFNRRIARKLQFLLKDRNVTSRIYEIQYKEKHYDEMKELFKRIGDYPDLTIELHFNAHKSEHARGYQVLTNVLDESKSLAECFTHAFDLNLMRGRYDKVVTLDKVTARGYWNLKMPEINNIKASVLLEPEFGTHRTNNSKLVFEKEDLYVQSLVLGITTYINR